jgi:hypothetical protein
MPLMPRASGSRTVAREWFGTPETSSMARRTTSSETRLSFASMWDWGLAFCYTSDWIREQQRQHLVHRASSPRQQGRQAVAQPTTFAEGLAATMQRHHANPSVQRACDPTKRHQRSCTFFPPARVTQTGLRSSACCQDHTFHRKDAQRGSFPSPDGCKDSLHTVRPACHWSDCELQSAGDSAFRFHVHSGNTGCCKANPPNARLPRGGRPSRPFLPFSPVFYFFAPFWRAPVCVATDHVTNTPDRRQKLLGQAAWVRMALPRWLPERLLVTLRLSKLAYIQCR